VLVIGVTCLVKTVLVQHQHFADRRISRPHTAEQIPGKSQMTNFDPHVRRPPGQAGQRGQFEPAGVGIC